MASVTAIMGTISISFNTMDNALLHEYVHYPEYKIEDRITFALIHACLYSAESDDERDNKSTAANTSDQSCDDGGSRSSLSAIVVFVSATSDLVCC